MRRIGYAPKMIMLTVLRVSTHPLNIPTESLWFLHQAETAPECWAGKRRVS